MHLAAVEDAVNISSISFYYWVRELIKLSFYYYYYYFA